jgi:hypothetical protein
MLLDVLPPPVHEAEAPSEELHQFVCGQSHMAKNRSQRTLRDLSMIRHRHAPEGRLGLAEHHVAPVLSI